MDMGRLPTRPLLGADGVSWAQGRGVDRGREVMQRSQPWRWLVNSGGERRAGAYLWSWAEKSLSRVCFPFCTVYLVLFVSGRMVSEHSSWLDTAHTGVKAAQQRCPQPSFAWSEASHCLYGAPGTISEQGFPLLLR